MRERGGATLLEENHPDKKWIYGAVPLSRDEIHDKLIEMMDEEPRGKVLDVPTGTGILAGRLKKMAFDVSCCDINSSYFSVPDLTIEIGDLNHSLPYSSEAFAFIVCIEGMEHLENPFNAIREFNRLLMPGGKVILSLPNYLNIERRMKFLITGLFSKIPSPKKLGRDRFKDLSMLHLVPLTYPTLKLAMEHWGFKILRIEKDKEKKRMKWLLPIVWGIRCYCSFWSKEKKEDYHLDDTLSSRLIMGGNTLILVAEKVTGKCP
jgi:ubiquinone/menaquinone biosynthesis C-methylase UbiE